MKKPKTQRLDLRVSEELKNRLDDLANELGIKRAKLIDDALWKVALFKEKFYVCCPTCDNAIFDVEGIPTWEGIHPVECGNGHKHWFDFDDEKFIK